MRQRLQRLNSVDQLLLGNRELGAGVVKRILSLLEFCLSRVEKHAVVVFDCGSRLTNKSQPVAMLHRQSEVLNLPVMTASVDVQLDGLSDSCHDYLGFSLLTFSPSFEGLSLLLTEQPPTLQPRRSGQSGQ